MGNFISPTEIEDGLKAADVAGFKHSDMLSIRSATFTALQESGYAHGLVDRHFSANHEVSV